MEDLKLNGEVKGSVVEQLERARMTSTETGGFTQEIFQRERNEGVEEFWSRRSLNVK